MTRLVRLREELRQRRHHPAFRISAPVWTEQQCRQIEELLAQAQAATPAPTDPMVEPAPTETVAATAAEPDEAALAAAATNLWRAERKLTPPGERPSPRDRQAARYLRTCAEALADAGLVLQDHDGDAFNPGRALEVLVYQENPALTAETVLETVRPSVYLHGRLVQMGQVIVGTPSQSPDGGNDNA
ncbi:hypothetical protein E1211_00535 [Micromonospora sp. 15K316]|uniref:hypothetical protein n=1 Tax=Micromonospora sp. 15K316 TaxID=2530376 RepID=UPI001052FA6A|nr:hypothetical protein [Micromonospora sp. 15K316]TDC40631.1 hypothetical protein E1211_00535 [Micromonospora sp. 15K316]